MSCKWMDQHDAGWMDQHDTDNEVASPLLRRMSGRDSPPSQLKARKHTKAAATSQEPLPCATGMQGTKLWQRHDLSEYVRLTQSPDCDLADVSCPVIN